MGWGHWELPAAEESIGEPDFKNCLSFSSFFIIVFLPPFAGLSPQGQRVIGIVFLAIVLWATEALPIGISSILILILPGVAQSVTSAEDLFHGLRSPILYSLIGGMNVLKLGLGLMVLTFLVILFIAPPWWSFLGLPLIP